MIKPTVGRVVWFWPSRDEQVHPRVGSLPHAATIAYVHTDTMVNLSVVDAVGRQYAATSVPLQDADSHQSAGYYATWMPYQQRQAAAADTKGGLADRVAALERAFAGMSPETARSDTGA